MAEPYIGQILLFAGTYAPRNFMLCNGQTLSISQNQALFSILGTTYGGDGVTTFKLPDLRGAVMVSAGKGPGRSNYTLGQAGGSEGITLQQAHLAPHNHPITASRATFNVSNGRGDDTTPNGNVPAANSDVSIYKASKADSPTLNAAAVNPALTTAVVGGNQPVSTLMPYLTLNYCICTQGLYPSRN